MSRRQEPASGADQPGQSPAPEAEAATTQAKPTQPRKIDPASGRQLDEHGLPLSGPARMAALAGKPDPREADAAAPAEPTANQEG